MGQIRSETIVVRQGNHIFLEAPTYWLTFPDGRREHFDMSRVLIGSGSGCDIQLRDVGVSTVHCELEVSPRGIRLRDLGSTNGTWVKGLRVQDLWLPQSAELQVGTTRIGYALAEERTQEVMSIEENLGQAVGRSPAMRSIFAKVKRVAPSDVSVLLRGETGTGKEVIAHEIYSYSKRDSKPFVVIDCGAISRNLIESELFGHEKGAFTGAEKQRIGAFERAQGGTIFLDEIGELPLELQPKLLRVLESKTIQRLGGAGQIPVDVRVISATHRDLKSEVAKGNFREDLFYRLSVIELELPPLRDRAEDIPALIEHFVQRQNATLQMLPDSCVEDFKARPWPGNCRELRNAVERALILGEVGIRDESASPLKSETQARESTIDVSRVGEMAASFIALNKPYKTQKNEWNAHFERKYVSEVLAFTHGNVSKAAKIAGIDRMSVHKILSRHELSVEDVLREKGMG